MVSDTETRPADMPVVGDVMRAATRSARSALSDGRQFWSAMAVLLGLILTVLGLLFSIGGGAVTANAKTYVIVEHFGIGGLRGHGVGWALMGVCLLGSVLGERYSPRRALRISKTVLIVISLDLFWTAFAIGLAGQAGGKTSWIATVLWAGLAFWPILQVILRPYGRHSGPRIRSAMIREGLTSAAADRVLAHRSSQLNERSR